MDDGEVVAALAAGDPAGLAAAYDAYAAPLYGYCRWMLPDPENAAGALRDTFLLAAAGRDGPRDASQLRAWLYAAARQQCYRRVRTAGAGFATAATLVSAQRADSGQPGESGVSGLRAEQAKYDG